MIPAVDTIHQPTAQEARALYKAGVRAFFGYVGTSNPYHLTQSTVDAVHGAGMAIGLFAEFGNGRQFSAALGRQYAMDALNSARSLGVPPGIGIAPAIDYDIPASDLATVDAHLTAWMSVIDHVYPTGLYGPPQALQRFRHKVHYLIQPSSWSGGIKLPGIAMWQNSVSQQLCGMNVDLDEVYDASILWYPKGVNKMSYPPVKVIFDGNQYLAVDINNTTYFIWTLARDAGLNLTKVEYDDVEIDGKKPRQWGDGENTYLCYADVPGIHPVRLADNSGWEFVKDAPAPVAVTHNYQLVIDQPPTGVCGQYVTVKIATMDNGKPLPNQTLDKVVSSVPGDGTGTALSAPTGPDGVYYAQIMETAPKVSTVTATWTDPGKKVHTVSGQTTFAAPVMTTPEIPSDCTLVATVPVTFANDAVLFNLETLDGKQLPIQLDTGAFELMLDAETAKPFNPPNLGAIQIQGVTGSSPAYQSQISFVLGGVTFKDVACVVDPSAQGSLFGYRFFQDMHYDLLVSQKHNCFVVMK